MPLKFNIKYERDYYYLISCHPASDHVVLAGEERETHRLRLAIYTVNGEFVRGIQLDEKGSVCGITVTVEGHISVTCVDSHNKAKVIIVSFAAVIRVVTRHATLPPTSGEAAKETKVIIV